MGKIAFLFAGQGAQYTGMGQSLYNTSPAAKKVFEAANLIKNNTSELCFESDLEELTQTQNTQPCVFCVGYAAAKALEEAGVCPQGLAGFSLGEVAAITFAGMVNFSNGFSLVCKRAKLMQKSAEEAQGGMAAVLRLADEKVEAICKKHSNVWPVNYNSDAQLVVAGHTDALTAFCLEVKQEGGMAKVLKVSGGFHSPMMASAAKEFAKIADEISFEKPVLPVYANLTAKPYETPYAKTLSRQIESPVLWKQTIRQMQKDGFTTFIEVGAGKTLAGLTRRILPNALVLNVQDDESLKTTLAALEEA